MLLTINQDNYDKINILYSEKTKNNILTNGDFYRIYYSNKYFTTNGVYLLINLKNVKIDSYFNKIKCIFDKFSNKNIISFIKNVEHTLLNNSPVKNKTPKYRIDDQLSQNFIKIFGDHNNRVNMLYENLDILLKISGIWCDDTNYGITFRFFINN